MDPTNLQNQNHGPRPAPPGPGEKPIPFDSVEAKSAAVSRQPISLGGPGGTAAPAPRPTPPPAPRAAAVARPTPPPGAVVSHSGERITGMKTFFAKLHAGSLTFLEEQIQGWLKENPGVTIKATNITTGDVQAKVTEPNLIIVVWY